MIDIYVPNNPFADTGYTPITSFWSDFTIADAFGLEAIQDTYNRAFAEWKHNYKFLTELVMVLNWKIWAYYEKNDAKARLYNDLWIQADTYAIENLQGDELSYFYNTTD